MYPVYRDVKDWIIIDCDTIYDFTDKEQEIPIVNILIGVLRKDNGQRSPITRWMTRKTFYWWKEHYE